MISFYNNAKEEIYNNPDELIGNLQCRFHTSEYKFIDFHNSEDLFFSSSKMMNVYNVTLHKGSDYVTVYCDDIEFKDSFMIDRLSDLNSLVFYNQLGEPLFYMSDIKGLPGTAMGERVLISISEGRDGLITINEQLEHITGSHYVTIFKPFVGVKLPERVARRSGKEIHPVEARPTKGLTGKRGTYKDLSMFGSAHPITGDIATVIDEHAIGQSLRTMLLTDIGERPFSSIEIAGNIKSWLFENIEFNTLTAMETAVKNAIDNYEHRIILRDASIVALPERNAIKIIIVYTIKATNETPKPLTIILNRA